MKTLNSLKNKIENLEELLNEKFLFEHEVISDFKKIRGKLNYYINIYGE